MPTESSPTTSYQLPITLFVLIGIQGSGKSTWARANAGRLNAVIVASDEIRNELEAAGMDAMGLSDHVFAILEERVARLLDQGRSVIVDATHARRSWRQNVLYIARKRGVRRVAVWFDLPLEAVKQRNLLKPGGDWGNRVIPEALLLNFGHDFEPPGAGEFEEVWKLDAKEVGA
jgi:predicted kinase